MILGQEILGAKARLAIFLGEDRAEVGAELNSIISRACIPTSPTLRKNLQYFLAKYLDMDITIADMSISNMKALYVA